MLPGKNRPTYAGLQVDVLERADGELMIRYHGETVYFQESSQPLSSQLGKLDPRSLDSEPQQVADGNANGHLNQAQQARWEAVEQAKGEGISLRAIARELDMSRVTVRKYAKAESPPTKLLSAKERAKAEALAASLIAAD